MGDSVWESMMQMNITTLWAVSDAGRRDLDDWSFTLHPVGVREHMNLLAHARHYQSF